MSTHVNPPAHSPVPTKDNLHYNPPAHRNAPTHSNHPVHEVTQDHPLKVNISTHRNEATTPGNLSNEFTAPPRTVTPTDSDLSTDRTTPPDNLTNHVSSSPSEPAAPSTRHRAHDPAHAYGGSPAYAALCRSRYRSKLTLDYEVDGFVRHVGLNHVGFLTLTTKNVLRWTDAEEWLAIQRMFNSVANFLHKLFPAYICVVGLGVNGRVHWHLLVDAQGDIRSGLDRAAYRLARAARKAGADDQVTLSRKCSKSANDYLRSLWEQMHDHLDDYGFGWTELYPIIENTQKVSSYMAKHLVDEGAVEARRFGLRIRHVRYSNVDRCVVGRRSSNSPRGKRWREIVALVAAELHCATEGELKQRLLSGYNRTIRSRLVLEDHNAERAAAAADTAPADADVPTDTTQNNGICPPTNGASAEGGGL